MLVFKSLVYLSLFLSICLLISLQLFLSVCICHSMTSHVTLHSCLSVFFSSYRSILRSDRHILHALSTDSSTVTFPLEMLQSMTPPIAMSPLSGRHQYANAMERFSSCYHVNPINHASIRSAFLLASSTLLSPNVTHGYLEKR